MDINKNIKRGRPRKEVKSNKIFELQAEVIEIDEENLNFKAHVEATRMNTDLASTIFKELIEKCVPEDSRCEVLNATAIKLGLRADEKDCQCKHQAIHSEEELLNLLKRMLGE